MLSTQPRPHLVIETPWNQVAIAWANGKTVFAPLCKITVRRKKPRTKYITLPMDTRAASGFRPTPRMPII